MTLSTEDRIELSALVHRYAAHVDDRQFGSVAELFTTTSELVVPEPPADLTPLHPHRGRDAIAAAVGAVAAVLRTEHSIVGEVYAGAPDAATGRITCIAHHWNRRDDEFFDLVWHLRYDDKYEKTDAGWRISRRELTINAIETRPVRRLRLPETT
ncbi:MAG: nuclear transport factor 2 family protein [Mycobacterium sp.]|uniref:nuclear transport factor 2 family protein n=1 Tax=Mycobacterium sp. TaxID=1785 RepID=UPI001EC842BD|nr:nuclear transport factor 2 family protein [Mycobacterium sp.]MBV8786663.1 nuclear transport factor 2 family protein [Mycobacterium sp.]